MMKRIFTLLLIGFLFSIPSLGFGEQFPIHGTLVTIDADVPVTKNVFMSFPWTVQTYNIHPVGNPPATPLVVPATGYHSLVTTPERFVIWEQAGTCMVDTPPFPCSRVPRLVRLCASITFSANANGQRIIKMTKNDMVTVGLPLQDIQATAGNQVVTACSGVIEVEVEDYFKVEVYVSGGGGPVSILHNAPHSPTYFSIVGIDDTRIDFSN